MKKKARTSNTLREIIRIAAWAISKDDDDLGRFADYEGNENGPTLSGYDHFGLAWFLKRCDEASDLHIAQTKRWKKLQRDLLSANEGLIGSKPKKEQACT